MNKVRFIAVCFVLSAILTFNLIASASSTEGMASKNFTVTGTSDDNGNPGNFSNGIAAISSMGTETDNFFVTNGAIPDTYTFGFKFKLTNMGSNKQMRILARANGRKCLVVFIKSDGNVEMHNLFYPDEAAGWNDIGAPLFTTSIGQLTQNTEYSVSVTTSPSNITASVNGTKVIDNFAIAQANQISTNNNKAFGVRPTDCDAQISDITVSAEAFSASYTIEGSNKVLTPTITESNNGFDVFYSQPGQFLYDSNAKKWTVAFDTNEAQPAFAFDYDKVPETYVYGIDAKITAFAPSPANWNSIRIPFRALGTTQKTLYVFIMKDGTVGLYGLDTDWRDLGVIGNISALTLNTDYKIEIYSSKTAAAVKINDTVIGSVSIPSAWQIDKTAFVGVRPASIAMEASNVRIIDINNALPAETVKSGDNTSSTNSNSTNTTGSDKNVSTNKQDNPKTGDSLPAISVLILLPLCLILITRQKRFNY